MIGVHHTDITKTVCEHSAATVNLGRKNECKLQTLVCQSI